MNVASFAIYAHHKKQKLSPNILPFPNLLNTSKSVSQLFSQCQAFWFLNYQLCPRIFNKSLVECLKTTTAKRKKKPHQRNLWLYLCIQPLPKKLGHNFIFSYTITKSSNDYRRTWSCNLFYSKHKFRITKIQPDNFPHLMQFFVMKTDTKASSFR